jgi:hypothetical protein
VSLLECTGVCALVLAVSVLSVLHWERLRELVVSLPRKVRLAPPGAAPRDPLV